MTAPEHRHLDRVAALLDLGRPEQALAELGRLPAGPAGDIRAFRLRAAALTELDRWAEVADTARYGLGQGPDAELLGRLGLALRHLGQYPSAERALLDALALAPHSAWLLTQYADLCLLVGQTTKAESLVARAAAADPVSPAVYASRYQLAYATGDRRGAEQVAREFLGRYPEHPSALALHGLAAAGRGRMGVASRSLGQAVAQDPTGAAAAEAAWETRVYAHPLLLPLRPLYRLGMFPTWLIAVGTLLVLNLLGWAPAALAAALCWAAYCVYSWVAPPIVRRLVLGRWRG
ncbi:tetratricopeptide repeat protein [Micromonospora echinofusca]|uniref:Tetratricopeptide repeat protein n=1 Tax=Micromonospora echinofusca TaxID=47858 RepID=A0ABS3VSR6_MICEH|nr:tetratricopeptide repeat protein [Micromonospora echinofusca]MBO4207565.1 tetratricopeptide repeat protein [Micromonospora echinofusca]